MSFSMVVNCYRNVNAFKYRPFPYVPIESALQLAFADFATRSVQNLQTNTKISRNKKKKIAIKHTFVTSRLSMAGGNREFQLGATFLVIKTAIHCSTGRKLFKHIPLYLRVHVKRLNEQIGFPNLQLILFNE